MKIGKVRIIFYTLLLTVLLFALYYHNNTASIYSYFGDFLIKNNQSQKGLDYYEKSISLGNTDSKFREKYVNTIINQPLTIDSQEKLVDIAEGEIQDSASSTAEYFLYNLKREIHNKYPLNYIRQAPFNQKIMHWGQMPITYSFKNPHIVPEEIVKSVNDAFDEWERASSCRIKFKRINSGIADIYVTFIEEKPNQLKEGEKFVVAYTTPILQQNKLKNMTIKLNIYDTEGTIYSINQIYNTALHEIFHALGFMGHSYQKDNIMYMSKDKDSVMNDSRIILNDADKSTLELLYKIKPDITNSNDLKYEYIPYLVLGDNDDINYSKINEAKNYIRKAPRLSMGYIDLAEGLVAQKKYPEAIGNLEKALRLAKNNEIRSIIYYNLAISHFYITNYDLALDYVNLVQEIKDGDDLHLLKAEIYTKQKNSDMAAKEYQYLVEKNPNNIDYAVNLAGIYYNKKNYIKVRTIIKTFLEKNQSQKNNPKIKQFGILAL